jgi:hypothetical protein
MPLVHIFIRVVEDHPQTDDLLDLLQGRLARRAVVGRADDNIPVVFFDDPPREEQHTAVIAALDAIDKSTDRPQGDWQRYLAVECS